MTHCVAQTNLRFHSHKRVEVAFDAPTISSDGGALLLRPLDDRLGVSRLFAAILPDERRPDRVQHSRLEQVRQRLYQIALGYEDCNDAEQLRHDPVFKVACDRLPREHKGLSSQPTLCRFENAVTMGTVVQLVRELERTYIESLSKRSQLVVLDIDTTASKTHGGQQLTFFHGFYDHYMYHPTLIFDEHGDLVTAILRPGNTGSARGAKGILRRLIRAIRKRCKHAQIVVRADSGFAAPRLYKLFEELNREHGGVSYILGLAKNRALLRLANGPMMQARAECEQTELRARVFDQFHYAAQSWSCKRRVIVKAEHSLMGPNPRFVVTSFTDMDPEEIYDIYCQRGQCENYIKELKNAMKADRLSCSRFETNFFRLLLHAAAYRLMFALREELAAERPDMGPCQLDTLRLRLLKVGAMVKQSVRRILIRLPAAFPLAAAFCAIAQRLDSS